jgi:hypothetical protein
MTVREGDQVSVSVIGIDAKGTPFAFLDGKIALLIGQKASPGEVLRASVARIGRKYIELQR